MHAIYELKETLCDELEKYGEKDNLSTGDLDVVHKLADTVKNLCKVIDMCEEDEYSGAYENMGRMYNNNMMRGGSYERGGSYARGGRGMRGGRRGGANQYGSYARGGYSREDGNEMLVKDLRELMDESPDERTKQEFHKFIKKIEQM